MKRSLYIVDLVAQFFLVFLVSGIFLIVLAEVIGRFFLVFSLPWAEDLATLLLVWVTFIGASVAYRRCEHIGIKIVVSRLPPNISDVVSVVSNFLIIFLLCIVVWKAYVLTKLAIEHEQVIISLEISSCWPYIGIIVGSSLMVVYSISSFMDNAYRILKKKNTRNDPLVNGAGD